MKQYVYILSLAIMFAGCSNNEDSLAVKQAFEGYKSAILNDDGEAAYGFVDNNTKQWYDETLERVYSFTREDIMKLGVLDKMQVLMVRHRIPVEELLGMSGEKLFKYAVNHGWVGKNSVSGLQVGDVQIENDFATGVVVVNGEESPLKFHFYNQGGSWKIDITELSKWGEAAFMQQIAESGQSEIDFIFMMTQVVSGKPVQDTIWDPILR